MMLQGDALLWFDDSKTRPVAEKIALAVARYRQKFHHDPDVCYVHPGECEADLDGNPKVIPAKSALLHHFWLGIEPVKKAKAKNDSTDSD